MIAWTKQGAAVLGDFKLADGRRGNVVLVAPRDNPKGATLLVPGETPQKPDMIPLAENAGLLHPRDLVDILITQERVFGSAGLPPVPALS